MVSLFRAIPTNKLPTLYNTATNAKFHQHLSILTTASSDNYVTLHIGLSHNTNIIIFHTSTSSHRALRPGIFGTPFPGHPHQQTAAAFHHRYKRQVPPTPVHPNYRLVRHATPVTTHYHPDNITSTTYPLPTVATNHVLTVATHCYCTLPIQTPSSTYRPCSPHKRQIPLTPLPVQHQLFGLIIVTTTPRTRQRQLQHSKTANYTCMMQHASGLFRNIATSSDKSAANWFNQSAAHCINLRLNCSINQRLKGSMVRGFNCSVNQRLNGSINQRPLTTVHRSAAQWFNQSDVHLIDGPVTQMFDGSINQRLTQYTQWSNQPAAQAMRVVQSISGPLNGSINERLNCSFNVQVFTQPVLTQQFKQSAAPWFKQSAAHPMAQEISSSVTRSMFNGPLSRRLTQRCNQSAA